MEKSSSNEQKGVNGRDWQEATSSLCKRLWRAQKRLLASSGQSGIETQDTRMQSQHVDLSSCILRWGKKTILLRGDLPPPANYRMTN